MAIIGVGYSSPESNAAWAADQGYAFELWTDSDERTLSLYYGAATSADVAFPARVTMVLDSEGILRLEYMGSLNVSTHPADVLEDCQSLFGAR